MPSSEGREGRPEQPARRVQTAWGCSKCKVNLCSELCFREFDHIHCCMRRELVVQYAREVPGGEVGPATEPVPARVESPATAGGEPRRRGRSGAEPVVDGGEFRYAPARGPGGFGGAFRA